MAVRTATLTANVRRRIIALLRLPFILGAPAGGADRLVQRRLP
jgi:hypothetical protein